MLNLMDMNVLPVDITVKHCSHIKVMSKETASSMIFNKPKIIRHFYLIYKFMDYGKIFSRSVFSSVELDAKSGTCGNVLFVHIEV